MPHASLHSPPAIMFGCQHLAAAVIKQAIADALDPLAPPTVRWDARQFLQGSEEYRFWCRLGGFDPLRLLEAGPSRAGSV